jgi:hypothetical protein
VNEIENDRLERAVERLMDGQLEALGIVRSALDGSGEPAEDVLADLLDILEGAYQDARPLGGYRRTGRGVVVHKEPPDAVAACRPAPMGVVTGHGPRWCCRIQTPGTSIRPGLHRLQWKW